MSVSEISSICGEESVQGEAPQGSNAQEEKIFVSVRLRPLNERELAKNDAADWECVNNSTIVYKNILQERSGFPTAYSFDRVFGCESSTRQVYDEAAKSVASSVVNGINSSIFAYGQTSSGKTYTMTGVTEYAISDIYDYINKHQDREFVLKFSALEIYNECVRDLLNSDNTQLRLLDDPERGTVVEKLSEVILEDFDHLKELLSICEAQRQIGETSLNEMSSRSHQILRLTVESSARKLLGSENSSTLEATVDFVDLAGSERASQALTASARLKEGCHINRSLLTLGTVIRKLSKGRNGHVPYRDSKLTRILQNSLGGNARTAIICTVSPAHSHFEQSRNTLLFASCAKQVSTNAQVNVVMSEKELVKKLQRELARLENELRILGSLSGSCDSASALKEKELLIEKMDKEIRELTNQRDLARSRLQDMLQAGGGYERSRSWAELSSISDLQEKGPWLDDYPRSEISEIVDPLRPDIASNISPFTDRYEVREPNKVDIQFPEAEDQFLSDDTSPTAFIDKYFGPDPSRGWEKMAAHTAHQNVEDICKEVRCIEIGVDSNTVSSEIVSSQQNKCDGSGQIVADNNTGSLKQTARDLTLTNSTRTRKRTAQDMKETDSTATQKPTAQDMNETDSTATQKPTAQDMNETNRAGTQKRTAQDIKETNSTGTQTPTAQELKENNSTGTQKPAAGDLMELNSTQTLKPAAQDLKGSSDCAIDNHHIEHYSSSSDTDTSDSKVIDLPRRPIARTASLPPGPEMAMVNENIPSCGMEQEISAKFEKDEVEVTELYCADKQLDEKEDKINIPSGKDTDSQHMFATEDDKPKSWKQFEHDKVQEVQPNPKKLEEFSEEALKPVHDPKQSPSVDGLKSADDPQQFPSDWSKEFERQRQEIIELWDACNITLVHRTYFFLLFNGEQSDSIYMEVELRRLSYLKSTLSRGSSVGKSDAILTHASNARALNHERKMLSKQIAKKFSSKEREALFQKWGIGLKTKQRRLQLCRRLWTDTKDMEHIKESASLVAKLVGIVEPSRAPKEIFGLSLPPSPSFRSHSWKSNLAL